ncbi:MAG: DNA internalization-related competence protein ComEC/Rec2 [Candidatus Dactylopiibacterium sp.]|nr:DNA internalization-related competence protein ComEC/Rec2 [Candidatus Dactylopiibacterium sp.]
MRILILLFALGVMCCQCAPALPPPPAVGAACLPLATLAFILRGRAAGRVALALTCCALGFAWAAWRAELRLAGRLAPALEQQDTEVLGRIADLPQATPAGIRFFFETQHAPPGVPERLLLTWYARGIETVLVLRAGEVWRLRVRLKRPHGNLNPHGFDYEAWLLERGAGATGYVRTDAGNARVAVSDGSFMARLDRAREALRDRFARALPDSPWRGVLVALVVGDQAAIPEAQWTLFRQTGITHLVSISGLHVTMMGALVAGLVGGLWRRMPAWMLRLPAQKAALPGGVLAAGLYVLLAGAGIPAQRTFYMLLVAACALWLGRQAGASRVMAVALLCVLVVDPWAVLSAGFWLSFGAVGALLLVGGDRTRAASRGWRRILPGWLRTQGAVTLLSLPLLLGLFQQFSLISPLANLVAIPLVSLVITPLALLFAVMPLPALAELANALTGGLMQFLALCARLPGGVWQQAAPPVWLVAVCVLGALWALLPRGVPGRVGGLLLCVPLLAYSPPRPARGEWRLEVLDVGQGLAAHIQTATRDWVFDAGPRYGELADAGGRVLLPYLRAQGVQHIEALILSHADSDHTGGAQSLFDALPMRRWYSSIAPAHALREQAVPHRDCVAAEGWEADGVSFRFLHPAPPFRGNGNERSCVLRISSPHGSALLTGDIGRQAEAVLVEEGAALAADVLVAPHHGSRTSSTAPFVSAVGARHVVFTAGYLNRFGHPAPDVAERYAHSGATLHRSDRDGAVGFVFRADGLQVERTREARRRYWHR